MMHIITLTLSDVNVVIHIFWNTHAKRSLKKHNYMAILKKITTHPKLFLIAAVKGKKLANISLIN